MLRGWTSRSRTRWPEWKPASRTRLWRSLQDRHTSEAEGKARGRIPALRYSRRVQSSAAYQALQEEINLGLLLPCNAVVYERDGQVYVGVVDAEKMLSVVGNPGMEPMARDVNRKLRSVVNNIVRPS